MRERSQGQREHAREILEELVAPSRAEEGCINYDLHQSMEDPELFVFPRKLDDVGALWKRMRGPNTACDSAKSAEKCWQKARLFHAGDGWFEQKTAQLRCNICRVIRLH